MNDIIIAIDGPSASGKSTVSKAVAKSLNFVYVDSGSLYRAVTWFALKNNIINSDPQKIINELNKSNLIFFNQNNKIDLSIDNFQPNKELRSKFVRENVAQIASKTIIRTFVVSELRKFKSFGNLVIEGRDIGSVVFTDAKYKFYLHADLIERANRRYRELIEAGENENAKQVLESISNRDKIDSTRDKDPLVIPSGARVIDSTQMSLSEVVAYIVNEVNYD
jgi:cytidylate kinase